MSVQVKDKRLCFSFRSLSELNSYLQSHPPVTHGRSSRKASSEHSWDLGMNYKAAEECLRKGGYWPEGKKNLKKAYFHAQDGMKFGQAPAGIHDVAGYAPDVQEFLLGNPCCMHSTDNDGIDVASSPIIKTGISMFNPWYVSGEMTLNRGAALLAVIDSFESQGYRCEIHSHSWAGGYAYGNTMSYSMHVQLKEASNVVDPSTLAFPLIHPAWGRRIGFSLIESDLRLDNHTKGGYGRPERISDEYGYDIFLDYMRGENVWDSIESSIEYLQEVFKEAVTGVASESKAA